MPNPVLLPRADAWIARAVEMLRTVQFEQDVLFDAMDSFRVSLSNSAIKREGVILEAAVRDAVDQHPHLRLIDIQDRHPRMPDVQFEILCNHHLVALEVKRGSQHDASAVRGFRADLAGAHALLGAALPLFPEVHYHILFLSGTPRLAEGLTPTDLVRLYALRVSAHILTARQRYSKAIKSVMRERGL